MTATATPKAPGGRSKTLRAIFVGYSSFAVVYGAAWLWFPRASFAAPAGTDTLLLAVRWLALPALFLFCLMQSLWRLLDTPAAEDPFAGAESRRFQVNQRVMSNSIEQLALFVPLHLALATVVDEQRAFLLPLHALLFTAGRFLFWAGYHVALHWRAVGFDWTFSTSCATGVWLLASWL